ncbi:hypothetical protein EHQ52_13445 [Leptospira koniambonensis]|uniref:Beta-propeller repeat protein n=1 Tax=Leptospira koniambonensis TaxID=2484950 RepID=A0A4R9JC16_9LEPT|nr:SBBP repeat-containing protein [Leptospira koniambonensis]TGL35461.1 hypothetical protein EHQ52_13445 [Leptospira koniambonensis]
MRSFFNRTLLLFVLLLLNFCSSPNGGNDFLPLLATMFSSPVEDPYIEPDCVLSSDPLGHKNTDPLKILANFGDRIFIIGETSDNLGGKNPNGYTMPFVMKFSNTATCRDWITILVDKPGTGGQIKSAGVDMFGNTFILGISNGNVGGETCTTSCRFLTKLDLGGDFVWTKFLSFAPSEIQVNSDGYVFLVGETSTTLNGQVPSGSSDAFLIKYDTDGNLLSTTLLGASGKRTRADRLTLDSSGNIYFSGITYGSLGGQTTPGTSGTVFIAKYDSNIAFQWSRNFALTVNQYIPTGMTTDPSGNVYLGGNRDGAGFVDGISVPGTMNTYVAQYDPSGAKQWTKAVGYNNTNVRQAGLAFVSNQVYTYGTVSGNGFPVSATGLSDVFFTSYDTSGTHTGTSRVGYENKYTYARSIYALTTGSLYYSFAIQDSKTLNIVGKTAFPY